MSEINYEYPLDRDYKGMTSGFARVMGLGDPTWKERHAKGISINSITLPQNEKHQWERMSSHFMYHTFFNGPIIWIGELYIWTVPVFKITASFCNFRYKKSWLEKGGRRG